MEIIKKYPETMDNRTAFKLMKSPEVKKMIAAENSILEVAEWLMFTDTNYTVLTVKTADGEMFGTISETFIKAFEEIVSFFGDDVGAIKVVKGTSKNGREFITCTVE